MTKMRRPSLFEVSRVVFFHPTWYLILSFWFRLADSIELCKKAASIVNYSEITMYFDYDELKDFFNDRDLIQGIVTSSQMYYVHIDTVLGDDDDHGENEDGADHGQQPPLLHRIKLIGTVDSIEAFQFLLAYQMHEWREIVALKTKLAELYQQILANQNSHNGLPFSMCVPQQQQQRQHQQTSKQSSPQQQQLHSYPQPLVLNMANAERGQFFHKSLSPKNFAEAVKANMRWARLAEHVPPSYVRHCLYMYVRYVFSILLFLVSQHVPLCLQICSVSSFSFL